MCPADPRERRKHWKFRKSNIVFLKSKMCDILLLSRIFDEEHVHAGQTHPERDRT